MSLSRFLYEPFYDFDRLFDEALAARTGADTAGQAQITQRGNESQRRALRPRMDVHEDTEKNIVSASFELPGMQKEDVSIDVHNNLLTVSGETKISSEHEEEGYAVRERRYGKFSRSIPLPDGTKTNEIKASMENGVLTVTFPKTSPEQAPRKITIS